MGSESYIVWHRDWLLPVLKFVIRWPLVAGLVLEWLMPAEVVQPGFSVRFRWRWGKLDKRGLRDLCTWLSVMSYGLQELGATRYFCRRCHMLHGFGNDCPAFVHIDVAAAMVGATGECLRVLAAHHQIRGAKKVEGQWFIAKGNAKDGLAKLTIRGDHLVPLFGPGVAP